MTLMGAIRSAPAERECPLPRSAKQPPYGLLGSIAADVQQGMECPHPRLKAAVPLPASLSLKQSGRVAHIPVIRLAQSARPPLGCARRFPGLSSRINVGWRRLWRILLSGVSSHTL